MGTIVTPTPETVDLAQWKRSHTDTAFLRQHVQLGEQVVDKSFLRWHRLGPTSTPNTQSRKLGIDDESRFDFFGTGGLLPQDVEEQSAELAVDRLGALGQRATLGCFPASA